LLTPGPLPLPNRLLNDGHVERAPLG
jgi:hypothetical protein